MPKCRPSKWVPWALLGAGLPFLGAWWLSSGSLEADVAARAKSALDAAESTKWAAVASDGRDVTISGESPTQAAIDDAVKAVSGTYGVRKVNVADVKLAALPAPTIESITTANTTPEIKGTWAEGIATTLAVTVAGATYKLGEAPELTSTAGNWLLKLSQPLKEGSFDATVEQSDGATRTAAAAAPAKVIIDTTPPALPVPEIPQAAWPYAITGTWGEEPGATLQADVNGKAYVLGQTPDLTSDGKGTYTFAPTDTYQPGSYDVKMTSTDPVGNVTTAIIPAAIVVAAPDAAPAPAPVPDVPVTVTANAPAADAVWPYALTGTWSEAPGSKLRARLAGRTYELGRGQALTSDGKGAFTFAPAAKTLAPGTYTVWFTAESAKGAKAVTSANIVIPEPPAAPEPAPAPAPAPVADWAAPTVEKQLSLSGAPIVKGTWAQGPATSLTVTVAGRTYELGKDANLSTKDGNWSLFPASALKDGIYDVVANAADAEGVTKRDATVAELEVDGDPPAAPAVTAYSGEASPPSVAGTWDEKQAVGGLAVTMPDINYTAILGAAGSPLTSDGGGNWSLALNRQLTPGTYEVQVTSTDVHGRTQTDATAGEVVITAPAAPAPAPAPVAIMLDANDLAEGVTYPTAITGKWSEGTALNLKAKFAGRTYELGKGAALTSDGQGNFTFAPAARLNPGSYTAWFTSKGPSGEVLVDKVDVTVPAPAVVAEPAPAPVVEPAPVVVAPERPFDCVMVLSRLNQVFPIRFEFDRSELQGVSSLALAQYAALLKDPRCADLKVEIGGHADFRGSEAYNQGLSERRANVVLGALGEAGIETSRLTPKGYSELVPLDPANTDDARTKNRRVEITLNKN